MHKPSCKLREEAAGLAAAIEALFSHTGTSAFAFHIAKPTAMTTFTAPASHSAALKPTGFLLHQPPIIPPSNIVTTEAIRLLRLTFDLESK